MNRILIAILSIMIALSLTAVAQKPAAKTESIRTGMMAPDFSLNDTNGKTVALSSIKRTTVLVFYRGYW